ncbi:MAG: glutamine ABC transporter ATP-binding protein [Candidatus Paraimprobicoccus trichonymphae]|uniref:Glutamine ABC transporter ATP-binding protein n=1 Tax=Candidatus Paraimprobicoccus trichonymphae TaxID=3033793 RepID=A0AA48IAC0_9FIRM|nr:MAG: glutamine ABC transporter ATP-binding protein [Candidatus Paraimprobicoccus trichonymphae]
MIQIKNLSKQFINGKKILKNISLNINPKDKIAIIGSSGSGKSTFLRCLNGLDTPTDGQIIFENKCITDKKCDMSYIRKKIGMVFQHFNLFPHLTVLQNITLAPVTLGLKTKQEADILADNLLKTVNLSEKVNEYPVKLSGGQKQRVAIVRTLAMEPKVILFDEPTSALDPEMVGEVLSVIRELDITMLVVTHEINFAKKFSNRVLFMDCGKIIADDSPTKIFNNYKNSRIEEFFSKIL